MLGTCKRMRHLGEAERVWEACCRETWGLLRPIAPQCSGSTALATHTWRSCAQRWTEVSRRMLSYCMCMCVNETERESEKKERGEGSSRLA